MKIVRMCSGERNSNFNIFNSIRSKKIIDDYK